MHHVFNKSPIALAVATAFGAAFMVATPGVASADHKAFGTKASGTYVTGDFHNHTTCSDGSISIQKLVKKSTGKSDGNFGLDWFVQAGHGGSGNRNCTLVEDASLATPAYPLVTDGAGQVVGPNTTWQNTPASAGGPIEPAGLVSGSYPNQRMWRWQALQEYSYPVLEYLSAKDNIPLFLGVETVAPGHEHVSVSVITGQMPTVRKHGPMPGSFAAMGNADALAQWEYCFDRNDTDNSRGAGNNWNCSVPGSANDMDANWDATGQKLGKISNHGDLGHQKTLEGLKWMVEYHPDGSYYVPAHLERAGPFNPNGSNGFDVNDLRDFNNTAPFIAFGFETQPGHGASSDRGEYYPSRNNFGSGERKDSVGGTTWGGTGVYGAQIGGVWDALLGEGRNWWFFASSDWHNRGSFGADDRRSTQDFYPGEYQRDFVMVSNNGRKLTPQAIVDGLRTGNSFAASGQLIDRLAFVACVGNPSPHGRNESALESLALNAAMGNTDVSYKGCATMGEKLEVPKGKDVVVAIVVRDPEGTSNSPYSFPNPSLMQIGVNQPLNKPVLDHVDVIRGMVTSLPKLPGDLDYAGAWPNTWLTNPDLDTVPDAAKNTTAALYKTFNEATWSTVRRNPGYKTMVFRIPAVKDSQYLRLRGSNLPASVPFETDANGNPLADVYTNAGSNNRAVAPLSIACTSVGTNVPANGDVWTAANGTIDGCPNHLPVVDGQKMVAYDVAAWADLWFYSNPIFIEVAGSTPIAKAKTHDLTRVAGAKANGSYTATNVKAKKPLVVVGMND